MQYAWLIIVILVWIVNGISKAKKSQAMQAKLKAEQELARQKTAEQYAQRQAQLQAQPKPTPQPATPAMSR